MQPNGKQTDDKLVCLGVITGAQGIRGQVRIKSFTQDPAQLTAYGPLSDARGNGSFKVTVTGHAKGQLVAKITGVADRNAAEDLKGRELYIDRDRLPEPDEDEFYHADLIGLAVETTDGTDFGTVKAVHDFGAGDILDITKTDGKGTMLPFNKETVPTVDLANGKIIIDPPVEVIAKDNGDNQEGDQA